jgi:L-seryl-tRNA(Ser) seleniumtransferase
MSLRSLPSIDLLLQTAGELLAAYGRPLTLSALRTSLDEIRLEVRAGGATPDNPAILALAEAHLIDWTKPTLQPVINATGVILHTNLGRAPLSTAALRAMELVSRGYSSLEFDLETGKRGSRLLHAEAVLQKLTGAEAALVVNNCASAVLLTLTALASRKRVIISRTQLVEIGGGFRIPEVMQQSGAKLVEVGATNKVRLDDYATALEALAPPSVSIRFSASKSASESVPPALLLHAHRSNFKLVGFTAEPGLAELAELAHRFGTLLIDDLGSGALLDTAQYGLEHEPTVQEALAAGADLVLFSGDKLLGGPQAGIILGRADLIAKLKKHPLARAVRADKTCLAGLTATLLHYLKDEFEREVPIWRMVAAPLDEVKGRAEAWQRALGSGEVVPGQATVGGGSLPGQTFPTWLLALNVKSTEKFLARLRRAAPPIIARTENNRVLLDPRTVLAEQEPQLLTTLTSLLAEQK